LLDYVDRVVSGRMRMAAVDRARFVRPVRPGDELRIEAILSDDEPSCVATVHTAAGLVAEFRLRYKEDS
jgi:3-hydroxyacyl-[acyl-carrier-protein] dehydratase